MRIGDTRKGWKLKAVVEGDSIRASGFAKGANPMYTGPAGIAVSKLRGLYIGERQVPRRA